MPAHLAHAGYQRMFAPGMLTLGFMFPITRVERVMPDMHDQLLMAAMADRLGFAALWTRDVPLYDPEFGDVGQIYDPWVWMGAVASHTSRIALSTGAIVLPVRHPLHVAKPAASLDVMTRGRFVLGLASGDRPIEFPAFNVDYATRGEVFRDHFETLDTVLHQSFPTATSRSGHLAGADLVPKPYTRRLPMLVVGTARQSVEWIAEHADGWVTYPRDVEVQQERIGAWKRAIAARAIGQFKPFAQSLFIDLTTDPDTAPTPIFLGYRLGRHRLIELLEQYRALGVNHVMFNLRHSTRAADDVMHELATWVLPHFPAHESNGRTAADDKENHHG